MTLSRESRERLLAAIARQVDIQKKLGGKSVKPPTPNGQSPVDSQTLANVLDDMMHASGKVPSNA